MLTCDNCGEALQTDEASILWEEHGAHGQQRVLALIIVHQECDDGAYENSAGCVYGTNWHPDINGADLFADKVFALPSDKAALEALIAQRRKDWANQ